MTKKASTPAPEKASPKPRARRKAKPDASAPSALPTFADPVLIVRTVNADMRGFGGFPWPAEGYVEAPEEWNPVWGEKRLDWKGGWNPAIKCGAGLHGLEEGEGDWGLLDWSADAKALIVETDRTQLVRVGAKVKFRSGIVRKVVTLAEALCSLFASPDRINRQVREIEAKAKEDNLAASGNGSHLAASGYGSHLAASGYGSRLAASGNDSNLAASGYASHLAASGYGSRLAASGNDSHLAASGYDSNLAASGNDSNLAASGNDSNLAASGNGSHLAASGNDSRLAASGNDSVVMAAGANCMAKAGPAGAIALAWHDGTRCRIAVGYVGEDGIRADTWYRIRDGRLQEA
jgi:hypothetical protein